MCKKYVMVRLQGRDPNNPKSRKPCDHTVQMLEIIQSGLCGTLTTVQKDNMVLEIRTDVC